MSEIEKKVESINAKVSQTPTKEKWYDKDAKCEYYIDRTPIDWERIKNNNLTK